ncbi:MAG: TIGR04211 family SH3 domain-containing protein [Methylococcales symbiont of Hymedesmia sp. n. MRB-2018]|nr:MAG: TIGR04211 family SH3 domain-containing protein [Methylococcales symbiont of Hymedesmia sp. n. MRB-2018]KAF3984493.1 MAG: TIGR04211 family SH3 domain-containing protein [Methylococcales symbiont of Hymedesmia sp. n. MRB-2018]
MKIIIIALLTLLTISPYSQAETVYVTDNHKFTFRDSAIKNAKILKMVPSGTALTLISVDKSTGYSKVRSNDGTEGYILTRYTLNKPISRWQLEKANKQLNTLEKAFGLAKQELDQLKGNNSETLSSNQSLTQERDTLSKDLNDLHQTASNAVQLKQQRDQLQERVISVERELQQVKRENQTLEYSTNQDWFLYGGILSLIGVILGFILPKLSWRRKTNNWNTF